MSARVRPAPARGALFAIIENFGYRQLATFWRLRGIVSKLRNVRSWGEMERKGFQATAVGA